MERTTTAWLAVLWGLLCLEVGCGARSDASPGPASSASTAPSVTSSASSSATGTATPGSAAGARGCPREHARHTPRGKYRHLRTRAFVQAQGEPKHAGPDAVVPRGGKGTLRAKLAYGPLHKDLEDEDVRVFVRADDCTFRDLGAHRTDDDGWVSVELDGGSLGAPGAHAAEVVVDGDGTRAEGAVYVVAPGSPPWSSTSTARSPRATRSCSRSCSRAARRTCGRAPRTWRISTRTRATCPCS
jgi:hypothetical protein